MSYTVGGQVQGVGFRPFVWRLATETAITGIVRNTSAGVQIEAQGTLENMALFRQRLETELPPLARITAIDAKELPAIANEEKFVIETSIGHAGQNVLPGPDAGICEDCLSDIRDPSNRRFAHPFANCTNCGPRFSITRHIPYDRASTSMGCFTLCEICAAEYADPSNRRFHAQPIACPACGPKIWYVDGQMCLHGHTTPDAVNMHKALEHAGKVILKGGILAFKGLGGFQLVCDARNQQAVTRLRQIKDRPSKALALMARSVKDIRLFCNVSPHQEKILNSSAKPITLCSKKEFPVRPPVADIAPDTSTIGVMLPYTPLHTLLMDHLAEQGLDSPLLVMTSANPRDEPICLGNREALSKLAGMADGFLLHNRDILVRVDDSVVAPREDTSPPLFLRRARGYTPMPLDLPGSSAKGKCVLGAGAELKGAFCLTRGAQAFPGQHIGDLKSPAVLDFYRHALEHMQNLLEVRPEIIMRDLHPDYMSSRFAQEIAQRDGLPIFTLQHHAAHAASALAENGCLEPALALCLDGSGLGEDGSIWGGELLYMNLGQTSWRRIGALASFALPGGEAAIREPWRVARGLLAQTGLEDMAGSGQKGRQAIDEMLRRNVACQRTSSCGRLFDAVSAILGLCEVAGYEGHAAILLEREAQGWLEVHHAMEPPPLWESAIPFFTDNDGIARLDSFSLAGAVAAARAKGIDCGTLAASFHFTLARYLADLAALKASEFATRKIALSGGVLQNRIMATLLGRYLKEHGLEPLFQRNLPPGDGGLCFGQVVWGRLLGAKI